MGQRARQRSSVAPSDWASQGFRGKRFSDLGARQAASYGSRREVATCESRIAACGNRRSTWPLNVASFELDGQYWVR